MRYLITGATGFVGPYLVKKLRARGDECRCLVRQESSAEVLNELGAELVFGDVTQAGTLRGMADGMDYVVHMATLGHMSNFKVPEQTFEDVNVLGTANVMREALRAEVKRVLHCSSVAAMGICPEKPATEQSQCRPHHAYGRSKLNAEREFLQFVARKGLPAVIVRFSMIYGPGDRRDMLRLAHLVNRGFLLRIGNRPKLTPLIHVEDAVQGMLLALEKGRTGEVYLISNEHSEPFDRVLSYLREGLGLRRRSIYLPEWMALAGASVLENAFKIVGKSPPITKKNIESTLADRVFSVAKAQRELGFKTRIDPKTGIVETVRWYREQGWV